MVRNTDDGPLGARLQGVDLNKKFRKQNSIDIDKSNMALVGSDLDRKVKAAAAKDEEAWKHGPGKAIAKAVGFGNPGLEIWRIEKFHVRAWPLEHYGKFFSGDSYIVLYTYKDPDNDTKFLWNVHFWIGNQSTQDEYGTAAYKTVELDALLGDLPVQYREVQGHESKIFRSYFSKIVIMEGGIESGFNHVHVEDYKPRLLHIKQKATSKTGSCVYTREVPCETKSLNSGDCFIYDAGMNLYQFNGKTSSGIERIKAAQVARAIDDERSGKPEIHVFDEEDSLQDSHAAQEFWKGVGGKRSITESSDDKEMAGRPMKLFRLSDRSGIMQFKAESKADLGKKLSKKLDSGDTFIFDSGSAIYAWIGKNASKAERNLGMQYASKYLEDSRLPAETPCVRLPEGATCPEFEKQLSQFLS